MPAKKASLENFKKKEKVNINVVEANEDLSEVEESTVLTFFIRAKLFIFTHAHSNEQLFFIMVALSKGGKIAYNVARINYIQDGFRESCTFVRNVRSLVMMLHFFGNRKKVETKFNYIVKLFFFNYD